MGQNPFVEPSLLTLEELRLWRRQQRDLKTRVVVTNGCFDLLHAGHVDYLQRARRLGDFLIVGLNSDASIRSLKGANRPIFREADRVSVLLALRPISFVTLFDDTDALSFLRVAEPDIYAKGGDYTPESLNQQEYTYLKHLGARIEILPEREGLSSSKTLERLTGDSQRIDPHATTE